ncbi:MAG TPA: LysR substrate-binding domain-containing protein [Burkholderiales bacterium]|nr:LysR substrate-binding domain-containing protein [Burkholderiales bacterium]
MDLVSLRIFQAVAESGGITRAAARLHRVQSNITTRVKQLEASLGAQLFHRHRRRLELSPEGRTLLAYAERLLALSSEARAALRSGAPRGVLRIGSLESTAATRLPPVLSRYHLAYPEVRLEMVTGTSGALVGKVLTGDLEAAFVAEPFTAQGLELQHAFSEELVLIAPKGFAAIRSARDAAHLPVLAFAAGCSYRLRLESWLGRAGVSPERVMEYGSYHAIVACVAAGCGIAVVPRSVIRALRPEREVRVHPLPKEIAASTTQLVWRRGHRSAALDALRSALAEAPARSAAASRAARNAARRPSAARPPRRSSARGASR